MLNLLNGKESELTCRKNDVQSADNCINEMDIRFHLKYLWALTGTRFRILTLIFPENINPKFTDIVKSCLEKKTYLRREPSLLWQKRMRRVMSENILKTTVWQSVRQKWYDWLKSVKGQRKRQGNIREEWLWFLPIILFLNFVRYKNLPMMK